MRSLMVMLALGVLHLLTGCKPPDVHITETPIVVTYEKEGHGPPAKLGDRVRVDYRIMMMDGREVLRADDFPFDAGKGTVIRGVDEAIIGMREGGLRSFVCPPHHHWGRAGYGDGAIPPATDLMVELRLNRIEGRSFRRRVESEG